MTPKQISPSKCVIYETVFSFVAGVPVEAVEFAVLERTRRENGR